MMTSEASSRTAVINTSATSNATVTAQYNSATPESLFPKHALLIAGLKRKYQEDAVIQRLFYDLPIPLEESYVNLAIVTEKEQQDKAKALATEANEAKKETTLIRDERLKTFESLYGTKENIELKDIFAAVPSQRKAVKQVLLLGTAGIGKSTACQKLCY
jgi:signal recognition particle GTPase